MKIFDFHFEWYLIEVSITWILPVQVSYHNTNNATFLCIILTVLKRHNIKYLQVTEVKGKPVRN